MRPIRLSMFVVAVLLLVGAWLFGSAQAAPLAPDFSGDVDTTFGANGQVLTAFGAGVATLSDIVVQPDQHIIAAGSVVTNGVTSFALARYLPDGTLDATFGAGGRVVTSISPGAGLSRATLQADGKIVVVGTLFLTDTSRIVLARYNPDGTLDTGFSGDGIVFTSSDGKPTRGTGVIVAADGKILVTGSVGPDLAVLRYTADGTLDGSFSGDGIFTAVAGNEPFAASAGDVLLRSDGKIVVTGNAHETNCPPISLGFILQLNTDGTLDQGFGDGGKLEHRGFTFLQTLLQPDQKLVVAGTNVAPGACGPAGAFFTVQRFTATGEVDSAFSGGVRIGEYFNYLSSTALTLAPDGTIYVVGYGYILSGPPTKILVAVRPDGTLDSSFGQGGQVTGDLDETPAAVEIQADGKIVVGGTTTNGQRQFVLERYLTAGPPPPTFTPTLTLTPTATPTLSPDCDYYDVCSWGDVFYPAVHYLTEHGVVSGYADGTFRLFSDATRGQVSKIVVLAEQLPLNVPASGQTFRDVSRNDTFFQFIETLAASGIASGYSCGEACLEFRPYNQITRGQITKLVVQAEGWQLLDPETPHFTDVSQTNPFYREIETAVAHGIISGYEDGNFRWYDNATRGQISKIVYQAVTAGTPTATPTVTATPLAAKATK